MFAILLTNNKNDSPKIVMDKKLKVLANGPLMVEDNIEITLADGRVEKYEKAVYICRCGGSAKKPFCDGSHKKIEFKD